MYGPKNPDCDLVHAEKYRGENEDFREAANRWSGFLQDNHEHYMAFRDISLYQRFMPPGRVQAGAGSLKNVTLYNCFVMATIHDSFTDGPTREELKALPPGSHAPLSIMDTAKNAAITMRQGGGVGYDISPLRPSGDIIRGVQSTTDGPLAFAPIYDAVCRATSSAGNRRGAQMLVMRIDHPDIEAFIRAKQINDDSIPWEYRPLRGFNMSIAVTDKFIECLASGKPFPLQFGGKVYREVDPHALWDMIMRGTYDWAEPGVLFIDRINEMNNLYYCETIAATNPCGEQPLPPYGACLLGSFNWVKYLKKDADGKYWFDYDQIEADIPHVVRAMDNVVDRSRYPLPQQKLEAQRKRRMGLGHTGVANALEAMGFPYGSVKFLQKQEEIMSFITNKCYQASANLAREKGSFPLYDEDRYMASRFIEGLWDETKDMIKKYGIRNSHLTSIAPTGTISFTADNVSSGIEPVLDYKQARTIIVPGGTRKVVVPDYGVEYLGVRGRTVVSGEITAAEHIGVLTTAQMHIDSACSKTVNVPANFSFNDFKDLYLMAYEGGAKGCTTYRPADKYDEPIKSASKEESLVEACGWDPETGQRTGACADE
jgi:ribonucleoside-diphosphate reductase alpha chain|tara:strand:+ start:45360 stop:47156 length:1797 start_codon:yes stop_codon:yes gene_type:complete